MMLIVRYLLQVIYLRRLSRGQRHNNRRYIACSGKHDKVWVSMICANSLCDSIGRKVFVFAEEPKAAAD